MAHQVVDAALFFQLPIEVLAFKEPRPLAHLAAQDLIGLFPDQLECVVRDRLDVAHLPVTFELSVDLMSPRVDVSFVESVLRLVKYCDSNLHLAPSVL